MNSLIERYIYDVTRRIPEGDRGEVSKELESNIYDMLPENADESAIKAVLLEFGPPASLADKYRQNPRYLISPAIYDDYIRVLRWVLPLVGGLALVIGMILGTVDAIKDSAFELPDVMIDAFSKGIYLGVSAAVQALVWTTVCFVIGERMGAKAGKGGKQEWRIEDLPETLPDDKARIPLADSVAELALIVIFSVLAILLCADMLPVSFMLQDGDMQVIALFSPGFLEICIPAIIVMALVSACECLGKIRAGRWTPFVCGTVVASNVICMIIMVYLINRPDLFSRQFVEFVRGMDEGKLGFLYFVGAGGTNPVIVVVSTIIVICSLAESGWAVYKTLNRDK